MIVYLARAIQAFVMYCVNGTSSSSLLIESTDSMIHVPTRDCTSYTVPTLAVITFIGGGHWEEGFSVGDVLLNILSSRLSPLYLLSTHTKQSYIVS